MLKLNDPSLLETRIYIDGKFVETGKTFDVTNPSNGEFVAQIQDCDLKNCRKAIGAAHKAQKEWAKFSAKCRSNLMRKLFNLVMENQEDLARIITMEMGKPFVESMGEVAYGASYIEWFAEEAKRNYGDTISAPSSDKRVTIIKQPVGVVGSITPWNFPSAMLARKLAPAMAAGCSIVARPSELTPLSAIALAVLVERAGIPAGVFNVLPSSLAAEIGTELCSNKHVAKITFTGSTRVGRILMRQCADGIKKMSMELGGNAPVIVFDDADLGTAVEGALISKYRNSGQTCVCANRLFVQKGIHDAFVAKFVEAVQRLKVGDGFSNDVQIGPLISNSALEKVQNHLDDAISKGAEVKIGGQLNQMGRTFFEPTVLTGVKPGMKILEEETFGPVAPIVKFETEEEVLGLANCTEVGLAGYFFSQNMSRCVRVSESLEVGMVGINTGLISNEMAPFGGIKQSGMGREGSKYGLDDYTEIKYICIGGVE